MTAKFTVLVVDDDKRMAHTLSDILKISGYQPLEAYSVPEAQQALENHPVGCVITDVRMPDQSGIDLNNMIREKYPRLPVLLMTAYASDELIQTGLANGAMGVLTKPLEISQLLNFLSALSQEQLIAIIDDDPNFSKTLSEVLKGRGMKTLVIQDPHGVPQKLSDGIHSVILDMKLNSVGGKQVLKEIRKKFPGLPVLLVTGYKEEMSDVIKEALEMNAYMCLYKPLDIPKLLEALEKIRLKTLQDILEK